MQERNVISGAVTAIFSPFINGWESLIGWLIVALVLIFADCRFGCAASRKRGETVRKSRIVRRSINKLVDYICWVSIAGALGGTFGKIFGIPTLAAIVMLVVCGVELSSIYDNYFEAKGIKKKFNVWKFLSKMFRISAIEESIEDKEHENNK